MMGKREDFIDGAFRLGAYAIRHQAPKVEGELPDIAELYDSLEEVPSHVPVEIPKVADEVEVIEATPPIKQTGTACLPCVNSHIHACVGLLNEANRFSHDDVTSPEVIKRVDGCLGEIVAAERVDLAPENIVDLPPKERDLAEYASRQLRDIRHGLEWFQTPEDLQELAAKTAKLQHEISNKWILLRLKPEDAKKVREKICQLIDEQV